VVRFDFLRGIFFRSFAAGREVRNGFIDCKRDRPEAQQVRLHIPAMQVMPATAQQIIPKRAVKFGGW
jgi:hypothetical protein